MSKSVFKASRVGSGSTVRRLSAASQSVSDSAHHSAAVMQTWTSSEKNSFVIQVSKKLKSRPEYENSGKNELLSAARRLISEEELFYDFSHLIQDEQMEVIQEATKYQDVVYSNALEEEAAKEREQSRFDRLARLKLTVCLHDIGKGDASPLKDKTVTSVANFLSMEYSGKHACILVEDVLLEWDDGHLIIPRRVTEQEAFIFEGDVRKTGEYFNRIAELRPQTGEKLKHFDEEGDILCGTLVLKKELIMKIIAVIVKYNSMYYYNMISRNCQDFVKKILEVARITGEKFSHENEEYLRNCREGQMRVPMSFKCHEDIDEFVQKTERKNGLKSLNNRELNWLIKMYRRHHGDKPCELPTCQLDAVTANLASRQGS